MVHVLPTVFLVLSVLEATRGFALAPSNVGITGGKVITIESAPFMALLFADDDGDDDGDGEGDDDAVCAGTVVHERFILTAAYCLLGKSRNNWIWKVLVGSDHRDDAAALIEVDNVYKFHPHELFENVCLLRLKEPVTFGPKVAKVELFDSDMIIPEGTMVNVTGWGRTLTDEDEPEELHQATVPVVGNKYCRSLRNTLICAGTSDKGACYGDIGGALTYNNVQIGLVSMVNPGCVQPAVFARISHYAKWIKKTIKDNQ